tara:strand:+ start:289 stop:792 length:504 start_codon:yes stop_codon:yes gene_type:complete
MKYTKGGFPFKTDLPDLSGTTDKPGEEVDLTKKTGLGPRVIEKEDKDVTDADFREIEKEKLVEHDMWQLEDKMKDARVFSTGPQFKSPARHGEKDPGEHKDVAAHKAWHKKHGFTQTEVFDEGGSSTKTTDLPVERDFSEHNISARKTEGTIEEQKKLREENEKKND